DPLLHPFPTRRSSDLRLAAPPVAAGGVLAAGPISLDKSAHRASVDGVEVELTAIEFKLLRTLIEREGRVQSRAQLLETVWHAQRSEEHTSELQSLAYL